MLWTDVMAAIRWWAVLLVIGAAATPLAYVLFNRLADRGYAFTRMLGLLIAGYLFWLLTSLGFLANNTGSMLAAVGGLAALSAVAWWRDRTLLAWLRQNRRQVLLTELLFAAAFALWVWVRAQNPAIAATEKPMEFAFLNAVGRSATFPPLDPWLSGYAISYYYFGYVMTSFVARLAAVPEPVAFNLGIAWLLAGTAAGAFGLVYNLVASSGFVRRARVLALVAALAIPVAGNLEIILEVLYGNGVGFNWIVAEDPVTGAEQNVWQWLDIREINGAEPPPTPRYDSTSWWWWRSSRVINEFHLSGRAEEGLAPIAEFPGFSFVLGDMHPHVLALPFAFLSLALAYAWWRRPLTVDASGWRRGGLIDGSLLMLRRIGWPFLAATALIIGGLSFLNTWDVLIHLFIVLGAFVLAQWREEERWQNDYLAQAAVLGVCLALPAILLYLPFYIGFRSQAGPPFLLPMLMRPTQLPQFLVIFGLPLTAIVAMVLVLGSKQRFRYWQTALKTAVGLVAGLLALMFFLGLIVASSAEAGRVIALGDELGRTLPPLLVDAPLLARINWGLTAVARLAPDILAARISFPEVTVLLSLLAGAAVMLLHGHFARRRPAASPAGGRSSADLPFVLLLILTGALLTLGPEFVYLRDQFGLRLNTIFKFYYQAWVLFGVAALAALDILLRRRWLVGVAVTAVYGLLLAATLLFPILAIQSRAGEYRAMVGAGDDGAATLDGLAYVAVLNPDEYAALQWLRGQRRHNPVILEAIGGQYTGYARVSANTGLPTLLGWPGHERQWRGHDMPELTGQGNREPIVKAIYEESDQARTADLLNRYKVEYIYVGPLEVANHGPFVKRKFDEWLETAFRNDNVTIYRWLPN